MAGNRSSRREIGVGTSIASTRIRRNPPPLEPPQRAPLNSGGRRIPPHVARPEPPPPFPPPTSEISLVHRESQLLPHDASAGAVAAGADSISRRPLPVS